MKPEVKWKEAHREQFADGSTVVTYEDGSMLIVESKLAKHALLGETRSAGYNDPPPRPPGEHCGIPLTTGESKQSTDGYEIHSAPEPVP